MKLAYCNETENSKEILTKAKKGEKIFVGLGITLLVIYLLVIIILTLNHLTDFVIAFSIGTIIVMLIIAFIYNSYTLKIINEELSSKVDLYAYINLIIFYNLRKKHLPMKRKINAYLNIASAYTHLGNFEKTTSILNYLETLKLDELSKAIILENKITLTFYQDDIEKFNEYSKLLETKISTLTSQVKTAILSSLKTKQAVINNDIAYLGEIYNNRKNSVSNLQKSLSISYLALAYKNTDQNKYKELCKELPSESKDLFIVKKLS